MYVEAGKNIPSRNIVLETQDGDYHFFKADILAGMVSYSTDKRIAANIETISAERANAIIEMNKRGERPLSLQEDGKKREADRTKDLLADADINRFDKSKRRKNKNRNNDHGHRNDAPKKEAEGKEAGGKNGNKENSNKESNNKESNNRENNKDNRREHRKDNRRENRKDEPRDNKPKETKSEG